MKAFTVRLDDGLAARVETVAKVDGIPIAELVRQALEGYVVLKLATDEFRAKLHATVEANQRLLEN
jgi:predicted transcriptional regulator